MSIRGWFPAFAIDKISYVFWKIFTSCCLKWSSEISCSWTHGMPSIARIQLVLQICQFTFNMTVKAVGDLSNTGKPSVSHLSKDSSLKNKSSVIRHQPIKYAAKSPFSQIEQMHSSVNDMQKLQKNIEEEGISSGNRPFFFLQQLFNHIFQ